MINQEMKQSQLEEKQKYIAKFPVHGKLIPFRKTYSLICNFVVQFIPFLILHLSSESFQPEEGSSLNILLVVLAYLIGGVRWTLGYHCLLHAPQVDLHPLVSPFFGIGMGTVLTFAPARVGHRKHHAINYGHNISNLQFHSNSTAEEIEKRKQRLLELDADYWFYSSPNNWILFLRCLFPEFRYMKVFLGDTKVKSSEKLVEIGVVLMRLFFILIPFFFANPVVYGLHLILNKLVLTISFMIFTTQAHSQGWFDSLFGWWMPLQRIVDINLVLELVFGYHVHHINDHDHHHEKPKEDLSVSAKYIQW